MKATLSLYRQAPRKVRLVADVIRGQDVNRALTLLRFLNKRAAEPLRRLLASALANAENSRGKRAEDLVIKRISVDQGRILKRYMPRARGRAAAIHKHTSHINIELAEK